jgi:putative ABC transport system permease protein
MIRTFQALRAVQPGFSDPDRVQFARLVIPPASAEEPATLLRVQRQIRDSLAAIPGVSAVASASFAPLEPGAPDNLLFIEGQTYAPGQIPPDRRFRFVSPGFFQTVGSRLIAGRDFTWSDLDDRTPVAIVSENLAREVWRDARAALGRRIRANASDPWREIVGVVGDIHDDGMHEPAPTTVYWPVLVENFWRTPTVVQRAATFMMRSPRAGRESLLSDLRSSLAKITPDLPVAQVRTLSELYRQSLARTSFTLVVLMISGATALLLGVVGIYGIVSYTVALRTRELGIRMALGAQHGAVRRLFLREGLTLAAIGVVCGVAGAIPLVRLMSSLLFGVGPSTRRPTPLSAVRFCCPPRWPATFPPTAQARSIRCAPCALIRAEIGTVE